MTAEQLGFGEKTRILFDFSRIFLLHQHEFREVISRRVWIVLVGSWVHAQSKTLQVGSPKVMV